MKYAMSALVLVSCCGVAAAQDWWKPYSPPCVERENVFEFTEKPSVKLVGQDRYEITFAVKGYCDATVAIVDPDPAKELVKGRGIVVRHLASGVLGPNAPVPFQKNSLRQAIYWNGKDDLDLYVRDPEKLQVCVMLGLKPEFDKLLGGSSAYNLPGYVAGLAASPEGVFVFVRGGDSSGSGVDAARFAIRHFGRDGEYIKTVFPPPANLPREKLGGFWHVEYEPGRWSVQGADANPDYWGRSLWFGSAMEWAGPIHLRPAVFGNRLFYSCNGGVAQGKPVLRLRWLHTDGSTRAEGLDGRVYLAGQGMAFYPRIAITPGGDFAYIAGVQDAGSQRIGHLPQPVVWRYRLDGDEAAKPWLGKAGTPGSAPAHFNHPADLAVDGEGRVYVADRLNNRIQIFSASGEFLREVVAATPELVQVHQKTGALYVLHSGRVRGQRTSRLSKFAPWPNLSEEFHRDDMMAPSAFALDSWSDRPRLWMGVPSSNNLIVWEEVDGGLKLLVDFSERARAEDGERRHIRWSGSNHGRYVACDPLRETVYLGGGNKTFDGMWEFDLGSGTLLSNPSPGYRFGTNVAFDKQGYMHVEYGYSHVARVDPRRGFRETPYDYGEERDRWRGAIPLHRVGRHTFGIGVNMRGDVAVILNVEVIPRMETEQMMGTGRRARLSPLGLTGGTNNPPAEFFRALAEDERRGVSIPYVPRQPGLPLGFGTIWTWDRSGQVLQNMAVVAGHRIMGVQTDEDGCLYFSNARMTLRDGTPFLNGRAVRQGTDERGTPFTGTYLKTEGRNVRFVCKDAPIPMEPWPDRPPDVGGPWVYEGHGSTPHVWVEGAHWLYAGPSPMKPGDCSCYQLRAHLDWFRRSYVPELYRHSIGVLDTNGNLVLHIGQYGNFDSAAGPKSRIPLGGDGIGSTFVRFISGTDNYLVFEDWGERLVVLKLNYHTEAAAPIEVR